MIRFMVDHGWVYSLLLEYLPRVSKGGKAIASVSKVSK